MRGETNIINIQNKDTVVYYDDTALATINNISFLKTGEYAFAVSTSTVGIPSQITASTRCMLKVIATRPIVQQGDYIMQYLYVPNTDSVYYRNIEYADASTTWGTWTEVVKLSIEGV